MQKHVQVAVGITAALLAWPAMAQTPSADDIIAGLKPADSVFFLVLCTNPPNETPDEAIFIIKDLGSLKLWICWEEKPHACSESPNINY